MSAKYNLMSNEYFIIIDFLQKKCGYSVRLSDTMYKLFPSIDCYCGDMAYSVDELQEFKQYATDHKISLKKAIEKLQFITIENF